MITPIHVVALAAVLGAAPLAPRYILFEQNGKWQRLDLRSGAPEPVPALDGQAVDGTITSDGKRIAWISRATEAREQRLFALDLSVKGGASRLIGGDTGRHADPEFASDGDTIYFSHHPRGDGPPGDHSSGANAQLYKTSFSRGGAVALTDDSGCHFAPARAEKTSRAFFVHTNCRDGRWVVALDTKTNKREEWTPRDGFVLDLAALDGGGFVAALKHYDGAKVLAFKKPQQGAELATLDHVGKPLRLWAGLKAGQFYIQNGSAMHRFEGGKMIRLGESDK